MVEARRGSHALLEALASEGCEVAFGIPGVGNLTVWDAYIDHPEIRHVETRHEQGAVFMADGLARATGRPGVAMIGGGPGALNTLTAMATAYNDSVPVLQVVNENTRSLRHQQRGHFHDIRDQLGAFRTVTGFTAQVDQAHEIPAAVHAAYEAMVNRRSRPALVEIVADALREPTDAPLPEPAVRRAKPVDEARVANAVRVLTAAERPIIWAGGGVVAADAAAELVAVAELLGAPILHSQGGAGVVSPEHPLYLGNWAREGAARRLLTEADVLLAVGTRFSYFPTGAWSVPMPSSIVHIDLDPAELGRNYPVEVGVAGDAREGLAGVLAGLRREGRTSDDGWVRRAAEVRETLQRAVAGRVEIEILDEIRRVLPHDALVYNDPTTIAFWARSAWRAYQPRTWFISKGFGTLGYALPAAIGGKIGAPDRATVAIMGDAGSMFTIQDLMTAVQERAGIVLLVFNDRGYGVERRHMDDQFGRRTGMDILPPDFVALAKAFGADGELVTADPSLIGAALERALERAEDGGLPSVIEVTVDFAHPGYASLT